VEAEKKSGNHNITVEQMWLYAVTDAQLTYRLWKLFMAHKRWVELNPLIWEDKQKLVRGPLLAMKRRGVRIDQAARLQLRGQGRGRAEAPRRRAGLPGKPTKSDPDPLPKLGSIAMTELFIDRLGLPIIKESEKTGKPSFDKEVMAEYDAMLELIDSPEAKKVKEYRGWQKAVSAAYRPYLNLVDDDGRLRCSYKLHGTVTGRFSCSEPNLQQVPKETDKPWNGRVKECFVPDDGYVLVNADFSQLELRLATAYANEQSLKQVFLEGRDIFTEMAALLGWERHNTKTFVYSVQYGAGVNRIMSAFGVDERRRRR
jgi:DNA polymerase-1